MDEEEKDNPSKANKIGRLTVEFGKIFRKGTKIVVVMECPQPGKIDGYVLLGKKRSKYGLSFVEEGLPNEALEVLRESLRRRIDNEGYSEDLVNNILRGLLAFYVLTALFILVNIASSIVAFLLSTPLLNVVSLASSILAALSSIIASIMITVAMTRGINALNSIGEKFGIYGGRGGRLLALTWVVSGLMVGATGLYFALMRRTREDNVLQWEMAKPDGSLGCDEKINNNIHQIQPQQPQSQHHEEFTYERRN